MLQHITIVSVGFVDINRPKRKALERRPRQVVLFVLVAARNMAYFKLLVVAKCYVWFVMEKERKLESQPSSQSQPLSQLLKKKFLELNAINADIPDLVHSQDTPVICCVQNVQHNLPQTNEALVKLHNI